MGTQTRSIELYEMVRNLPYATDAATDAPGLRVLGRGSCVAKASLLAEELAASGQVTRLVSWEYKLPVLVQVQQRLRFRSDVHTAVQVRVQGRWIVVDAAHDPPLARLGLCVGRWDGLSSTAPAYPVLGPVMPHSDPSSASQLAALRMRIGQQVEATEADLVSRYQRDLNELFERARQQAT